MASATQAARVPPALLGLFLIFSRIGLTRFGGGLSGWRIAGAWGRHRRYDTRQYTPPSARPSVPSSHS
jgi:hypothetical protein